MITLKITKQIARLLDIPYIKSELGNSELTRKLIIEISDNKAKLFSKNKFCGVQEEVEAVSDQDITLGLELPKQISSLISQDGLTFKIQDKIKINKEVLIQDNIKINNEFVPMMSSNSLREFLTYRSDFLKKYKQKNIFAIESKQFAHALRNEDLKIVGLGFQDQKLEVSLKENVGAPTVEKKEISLIPLIGKDSGREIYFQRKILLRMSTKSKGKIFIVWSDDINMPLKIMSPERDSFAFWIMRCLEQEFETRTLNSRFEF